MLKTFTFLLCTTVVSIYAACRSHVTLTPGDQCGPNQTMFNEGERLCCYYDTMNIPTIGIGFNLKRRDAAKVMSRYNLTLSDVLKDCSDKTSKYCLTDENAKDIFNDITYPEALKCADAYVLGLPAVIRAAVTDVAFAGCSTLNKFVKMQTALKKKDWKTAANELKDSNWCEQVGQNRCNSDYNCIAKYNSTGCIGGSCKSGRLVNTCSSNPNCSCFKTTNESGFCAEGIICSGLPDCTSCSSSTSVCVIDSCCYRPICYPLSLSKNCMNPPTNRTSRSNEPASFERSVCKEDQDCALGTVCKRHSIGSFCV